MIQANKPIWTTWARTLQHWKLDGLAAVVIDSFSPMGVLLVQLIYIGQPFIKGVLPPEQVDEMTRLLENPEECKLFARYLREEETV
jgi:hypothetical protein